MAFSGLALNISFAFILILSSLSAGSQTSARAEKKRPNIVFILADDHRYDAMGFTGAFPGLETQNMDRMAKEGIYFKNAVVTTALCSPSRASILSGQYAHRHRVVDNQAPVPENLRFFPEYLQKAGYQTAFLGKWHMGEETDKPRKGFNYWASFKGQGEYYNPVMNINGKQVPYTDSTYTTDLLTNLSIDWLKQRKSAQPFFLYLSHKGVHAMFQPATRHRDKYKNLQFQPPPSMFLTAGDVDNFGDLKTIANKEIETKGWKINKPDIPSWVWNQRYSWHGVDYLYHGELSFIDFYRRYLETLLAVDDSVGKVLDYLESAGLLDNTIVFYMGDNGFSFGEHGLIDKRHAYEESMRVPLLVYAPPLTKIKGEVNDLVRNIDIAPTILEMAGIAAPPQMQGRSFLPSFKGVKSKSTNVAYYEYYWEYAFPQTPTLFAARTDRYKYIYNHGVWDINELYDLRADPYEMNNLIRSPEYQQIAHSMRDSIFNWLEKTGGSQIPLRKIDIKRSDNKYNGIY
ncbi:sulfatase [Pollutibacter soli]|uniref:sulfatase family protein n=1 Tax=Pollutibacter soli TaxID=3034157 RepID=UPI00301351D5